METTQNQVITLADDSIKNRIRTLYMAGKEIQEIQAEIGISENTWQSCYWRDQHGFRSFFLEVKKEKMIKDAEAVSKKILNMDTSKMAKLLTIQQKEAEFIRETQGKELGYTKRTENVNLNIKREPLDDKQVATIDRILKKQKTQKPESVKSDAETV